MKIGERDLKWMREVKIFGDTVNCEAREDSGDFVGRVLNELGEPSGEDSRRAFRGSGAIGKRVRDVLARCGAVIGCFHVGNFLDIEKKKPREQCVIQLSQHPPVVIASPFGQYFIKCQGQTPI